MSKTRTTIRLDDDILEYFKSNPFERYQTRINRALRRHMELDSITVEDKLRTVVREELLRLKLSLSEESMQ